MDNDTAAGTSPVLATAQAFLDCMSKHDWTRILTLVTDDFVRQTLPASLAQPTQSKDEMVAYFSDWFKFIPDITTTIKAAIEEKDKVWLHVTSVAHPPLMSEAYSNEYVLMFYFKETPDGPKITLWNEFVDSGYSKDYLGRLRAAAAAAKGA